VIRFDRVTKRYGRGREVITQLSFEVADGEMVLLTGRSGAGKSTALRLIALLERATQGQIWVNGENLATVRARDIPPFRRRLGLVFQEPRLLMDRSVFDNVALPLLLADMPARARRQRVRVVLEQIGLLSAQATLAAELSAGEQARVAIARALAAEPPLLLADEPCASLDALVAAAVMKLLRQLNSQGTTVVVATHDQQSARESGLREIPLDHGDASSSDLAALPVIAAVR
jgi:cell division transport system ATP-binding protein